MSWKLFWEHENKFDEAEREALIGTIVDSVIEAASKRCTDFSAAIEFLESESPGFVYVPEGTGVTSTVWPGGSTYSSTTTTWYSSTREGVYTLANDV